MKGDYPRFKATYTHDELVEHFLLNPSERAIVDACYGDANRHTVAVLLKTVQHLGACAPASRSQLSYVPPRSGGARRWMVLIILLLVCCGLRPVTAIAGKRARPIRIGAINAGWGPTPSTTGLRDGLLTLGYKENEDFILGVRFTRGDIAALPTAARELVQYGVDLIFATQESPAKAAQLATSDIPIVFASVGSPIELGLIQSFARPGGNITGVADLEFEILAKRLEIFKDLVSGLQRVLFLYNADHPYSVMAANTYREAAGRLGLTLIEKPVRTEAEAQTTLAQIQHEKVEGVVQPPTPSLNLPGLVLEFAIKQAIPSMFNAVFWVEQGALTSYGPDFHESGKQAARLVDKIIKGAAPADIPVEVNSKIELVINLKTAKALELTVPPEVLFRADRIIR